MITRLLIMANAGTYRQKREWFYPFKTRFLRRFAAFDGYDKQVLTRKCWHCSGTGIFLTCYLCSYLGGCDRCRGCVQGPCSWCGRSGVYRIDSNWLERRLFGGTIFHIPVPALYLPALIPEPVTVYKDIIQHDPVDNKKAWRAALILIVIFDVPMIFRMCCTSIEIWIYRLWWRNIQKVMGRIKDREIPF